MGYCGVFIGRTTRSAVACAFALTLAVAGIGTPGGPVRAETVVERDARTVTSNNPKKSTRFSLLHEVPAANKISGERRYRLLDAPMRLALAGDEVRILGDHVVQLDGMNSRRGNTGRLTFHDGGRLEIGSAKRGFSSDWDLDGANGDGARRVTPSHVVTGELPVRLELFAADGSTLADEEHVLFFKAFAMGPYNGAFREGDDVIFWLWGRSRERVASAEFTYLGLDIAVSTFAARTPDDVPIGLSLPDVSLEHGATTSLGTLLPETLDWSGTNSVEELIEPAIYLASSTGLRFPTSASLAPLPGRTVSDGTGEVVEDVGGDGSGDGISGGEDTSSIGDTGSETGSGSGDRAGVPLAPPVVPHWPEADGVTLAIPPPAYPIPTDTTGGGDDGETPTTVSEPPVPALLFAALGLLTLIRRRAANAAAHGA